uniref:Uncharacterized protein n=1 Tax=viral metagenome TaxID=1070528 RepID=A0A6C0HA37_9ZZZZ
MDRTTIIVLVSLVVGVIAIVFFGMRSTTKTIDNTLQEARDKIRNDAKYNNVGIVGGSRSKSKTKPLRHHPYLTTTNAFLLFSGVFIGYILSHFR